MPPIGGSGKVCTPICPPFVGRTHKNPTISLRSGHHCTALPRAPPPEAPLRILERTPRRSRMSDTADPKGTL